jgi:PRTRC genetic system protein E
MFKKMESMIPEKGSIRMTMTRAGEQITVSVLPVMPVSSLTKQKSEFQKDEIAFKLEPLTVTGTAEELDAGFADVLAGFVPAVQGFTSNLEFVKAKLDAEARKIKDAAEAKKAKTAGKGSKHVPSTTLTEAEEEGEEDSAVKTNPRLEGVADQALMPLLTAAAKDAQNAEAVAQARKAVVEAAAKANLATLEAALRAHNSMDNRMAIAKEIKKLTGKSEAEILVPALTELYKASPADKKGVIGHFLEKIAGKSLADLGLAPRQPSLLGGIGQAPTAASSNGNNVASTTM